MRAILNTGPGALALREVPTPGCGAGEVRVRTACCGICATDLQMIAGWDRTGFPSIPGHEWAGVVDAVGPGTDPGLVGRPCVAENVLADGGEVGFEHPGGYGEYLVTEARNLHLLAPGVPLHSAPLVEPLAVCVHALARAGRTPGAEEPVLVIGDGTIGLLLAMLLHHRGCRAVSLLGGRPRRLELAREVGAAAVARYHDFTVRHGGMADDITAAFGRRFPMVFEASGSAVAMEASPDVVEKQGTIVEMGDYGAARAGFPWNRILHREITILGSNASAGGWPEAVRLAGELPLALLVTHRMPVHRFAEGMALVRSRDPSVVKVVLDWVDPCP